MFKQFEIQARGKCCDENDGDDNEWEKTSIVLFVEEVNAMVSEWSSSI